MGKKYILESGVPAEDRVLEMDHLTQHLFGDIIFVKPIFVVGVIVTC